MHGANTPYEFSQDWFQKNIPVWEHVLARFDHPIHNILEIGSFEGRSAVWFLERLLRQGGEIHCVDSWLGGEEHADIDMAAVEKRFDKNIQHALNTTTNVHFEKHKGNSRTELAKLIAAGKQDFFDLIYIDGGHTASDVLSDLVMSWELCAIGGLYICDDYLWNEINNFLAIPKLGIDSFLNCNHAKIKIWKGTPLGQIFFCKIQK